MADNTQLNNNTGGDTIRTDEVVDYSSGTATSVKTQVVKLATGRTGVDGGVVSDDNPLPVFDSKLYKLMEKISGQLDELLDAIRNC